MNASLARTLRRFGEGIFATTPAISRPAAEESAACAEFLRPDLSDERRELVVSTLRLVESTGVAGYAAAIASALPLQGKRLLEIGAHYCWYAPLLLKAGCRSYHGVDLEIDPGQRQISGSNGTAEALIPFGEFIDSFAALSQSHCDVRDLPRPGDLFDAAFMVSTSEHFDDPRGSFAAISALLAPGGTIFINHHNYFGWNGHHRAPWRVEDINLEDPLHRAVVDWAHVRHPVRNADSPNYLNYIRIHELVDVVLEFFDIEYKTLVRFEPDTGEGRLTPAILEQLPRYYQEELETISLKLWARNRGLNGDRPATRRFADEHGYIIEIAWAQRERGNAFVTRLPSLGKLTGLRLYEDGIRLQPGDALHDEIRTNGAGAYSIWGNYLYFSTSDNTDPAGNGRRYVLKSD
jgi:SAM-dependent methyltransferase